MGKSVRWMLVFAGIIVLIVLIMQPISVLHFGHEIAMLYPKGIIALKERNLLFILQILMLIVIIPVYILTFVFSWKYRSTNPNHIYDPDLVDNKFAEIVWWGIPFIMTVIVAALTLIKTEQLDPYKPLKSEKKPLNVQVVALQWKWLFIYPEEKIASVNYLMIPVQTPINFEITADAPMNSFWIPSLGGQIYAMPNMKTKLHLMADQEGDFRGSSANLSGEGFAKMHFITSAASPDEFQKWVGEVKKSASLDWDKYKELAKPNEKYVKETYQLKDEKLFDKVINQFMKPKE